jgi:uncharacterized membrane protein
MQEDFPLSPTAKRNLATIADIEQQLLQRRPLLERLGETIAHFFGRVSLIAAHTALIGMWVLWNVSRLHSALPFDPYPFSLLSLGMVVEFILLTTFVLMYQKHQSLRNEDWAHLQLQLSMLIEQEGTKTFNCSTRSATTWAWSQQREIGKLPNSQGRRPSSQW